MHKRLNEKQITALLKVTCQRPRDRENDILQAKFLKACGALPETPAEIWKASKILEDSPSNGDSESLKFHSWLPNTSILKLNLEMQAEQPPAPINFFFSIICLCCIFMFLFFCIIYF